MTDFLESKQREIAARLTELEPLLEEYARLEQAATALAEFVSANGASGQTEAAPRRRGRGRPPGSKNKPKVATTMAAASNTVTKPSSAAKRKSKREHSGRRLGSGKRAGEALSAIQAKPGITAREIAVKIGINPTYIYSVLPTLEASGKIVKRGKGWESKTA